MPQITINSSPNISAFGFSVSVDIYNRQMVFDTSALTTYISSGMLNVLGISFFVEDSVGVELLTVDWVSPQIIPASQSSYVLDLSTSPVNFLFQPYKIIGYIKDADGTVYQTEPILKKVGEPSGITSNGYVPGNMNVIADCTNNNITVKEFTPLVYCGKTPLSISKEGTLYYPTGTIDPVPFSGTPFSNNKVYTGQFRVNCITVATYDFGDDFYVLVSYITNRTFPVTCSNFLGDITCCLDAILVTYSKNCENAIGQAALQKYNSVTPYVLSGILKQNNGQDASMEVAEIKKLLNCDCGASSVKQGEQTPTDPSVYSIVLNGAGDVSIPAAVINGNTKTFTIASPAYQVAKGDTNDLAFTIKVNTSTQYLVSYSITFNYNVMAQYIVDALTDPANASILSQLNSLITAAGASIVGLNGKCVIDLSTSNYSVSQIVNPSTEVVNIVINGATYTAPTGLFAEDVTALASWLNSLTLGTFTAVLNSTTLTIQSVNNDNTISTITFSTPGITKQFSSTNATLLQVLQAIVDYLCEISSLQVALGRQLTLCYFDYNGSIISSAYTPASTQDSFNTGVASAICNIVTRIDALTGLTCDKLKAIFIDRSALTFGASDRIYGTLDGNCAGLSDLQVANLVIAAVGKYSTVKAAWCAIDCAAPGTCPDVSNISLAMSASNIGVYGLTWAIPPSASQTVTIKYRVNGTITWTVATNALLILPNGNISGTSPYLITGLNVGTIYDVWIQNNCGGTGFVKQITTPTGSVYTGSYYLENILYDICGASLVTLYSSQPFASGVVMYTDIGLTTPVTGFTYITISGSNIYAINTSTGVVGLDTGSSCSNGVAGAYKLGNNTSTICPNAQTTLYTDGAFAVGKVLYIDASLTTPQTGYSYAVYLGTIYNVNTVSGAIGVATGSLCSIATVQNSTADGGIQQVTGINGFTPTFIGFGTSQSGAHGAFTGTIIVEFVAPASAATDLRLYKNGIELEVKTLSGGDGTTQVFGSQSYQAYDSILITWASP